MSQAEQDIRTFICFEIPEELRRILADIEQAARKFGESVSWTRPENIHLTLKFIGNTSPSKCEAVTAVLQKLAGNCTGMPVRIDRLGAFPGFTKPRVFWAGSSEQNENLAQFVRNLEEGLEKSGIPRERRAFTPHLTIGRVKRSTCPRTAEFLRTAVVPVQTIWCRELVFMQSTLTSSGAIYKPIVKYPLKEIE